MAYPFPAIDPARTTARLSAFLSEIIEAEPVDQFFEEYPTIGAFMKVKKTSDAGQWMWPVRTAGSDTIKRSGEYDPIIFRGQNNAYTVVENPKLYDGSISFSILEMAEVAKSETRAYDRVQAERTSVEGSTLKLLNEELYASSQVSGAIQSLAVGVDSAGSMHNLNASTVSVWASQERAHSALFAADGFKRMLQLYDDLKNTAKSVPTHIFTTPIIRRAYQMYCDGDIRYADTSKLGRGADEVMFMKVPIIADNDCTSQAMFFLNMKGYVLRVLPEANWHWEPFKRLESQWVWGAPFVVGLNVVCTDRRGQGKITGISDTF